MIELLLAEQQNRGARKAELNTAVGDAIAHVVQKQIESGIDVINDGEQGRTQLWITCSTGSPDLTARARRPSALAIQNFPNSPSCSRISPRRFSIDRPAPAR